MDQAPGQSDGKRTLTAPSISLPKGGGAVRGIGEKFAANPVTGTGSMRVPIATSPGRYGTTSVVFERLSHVTYGVRPAQRENRT